MKRFNIRIISVFLLSLVVFFACKKKDKETGGGTDKPVTGDSYNLKDFVIQDASDGNILDFMDVHKIVQHTITEVANADVVDTIYASVMVELTALKLKPRFYDIGKVTAVDPDTNEVRDLTKYDGQPYPTMKVTFNTGVVRTFALVVSQATQNEDNENLLKNQNIYFIKEYKITNGTNDIAYTAIKMTNNQPVLQQKDPIKDTIEFEVVNTNVGAGNKIVFSPLKYGVDATDTVVANLNPTSLEFDHTLPDDYKDYKTMSITFSNGFVREYAVKVNIIDNNASLNKNAYIIGKYNFQYPENTAITGLAEVKFTQHTPTDRIMQKDTIEVTVPSTFSGSYVHFSVTNYGLDPATYAANDSVKTTVKVTGVAHDGTTPLAPATGASVPANALVVPNTEFGEYVTITYTFSNGFKREYAVKVTKQLVTTVNITNFQVSNDADGNSVLYYRARDNYNLTPSGATIITQHMRDTGRITIVRPLNWADGRKIKIKLTGVDAAVQGTVSVFNAGENIGSSSGGSSSLTDGSFVLDFTNVNSDSLKLTLQNTNPGGDKIESTIKLYVGKLVPNPTLVMNGLNTIDNYTATPNTNTDKEFKIAVDENNVYILIMNRATGKEGSITAADVYTTAVTYDLYYYPIRATAGSPTLMGKVTDVDPSKNLMDIVAFDNTLYGIAVSNTTVASGNKTYRIFKWDKGNLTASPTALGDSTSSVTGAVALLFTADITTDNNINFYSINSAGKGLSSITNNVIKITAPLNGSSRATLAYKTQNASSIEGSSGYGTYLNLSTINRSFLTTTIGYVWGYDFSNSTTIAGIQNYELLNDGSNTHAIGANVEMIRDKYYFIYNLVYNSTTYPSTNTNGHRMAVLDLGKDIVTKMDAITTAKDFYNDNVVFRAGFDVTGTKKFSANNNGNRGNCRTYKLPNGKIRIASLLAEYGFQVWDME